MYNYVFLSCIIVWMGFSVFQYLTEMEFKLLKVSSTTTVWNFNGPSGNFLVHTDHFPVSIVKPIFMGTFAIASEQVCLWLKNKGIAASCCQHYFTKSVLEELWAEPFWPFPSVHAMILYFLWLCFCCHSLSSLTLYLSFSLFLRPVSWELVRIPASYRTTLVIRLSFV